MERPVWARTAAREWSWIAAVAAGSALRGFRLLGQVPVDDEWHSIHRLIGSSYGEIALDFGFVDHCIPLTLYLKLAADTIGVNAWVFRAPSFVAGVALLVAAPLALRPQIGPRAARVFAWLLAISPLLVLYSRFQRPYAMAVLLSFLALALADRWWRGGRPRDALGFAACGALSAYFLPPTLPFVAAPLGLMALAAVSGRGGFPARRLALPLASFAGGIALLLGPPLWSHPDALLGKIGGAQPDLASLGRALRFLAGTPSAWLTSGFFGLAAVGAWRLQRHAPVWSALALFASALLALGILASAPRYAWLGIVNARYALPMLPIALAWIARVMAPPDAPPGGRRARDLAAAALIALLLYSGGVPHTLLDTRAWFPGRFVAQLEGRSARPAEVPRFYRGLAAQPGASLTLVESPWFYSLWNSLLPFYEGIHRQHTLVGMSGGACTEGHWGEVPPDSGLRLPGLVRLADREALLRRGVDFVVFHDDLVAELEEVVDPIDARATGQPDVRGCVRDFLESDWPLVYQDAAIVVFAAPGAPELRWPADGEVGY
jgi:hypothetical protein